MESKWISGWAGSLLNSKFVFKIAVSVFMSFEPLLVFDSPWMAQMSIVLVEVIVN